MEASTLGSWPGSASAFAGGRRDRFRRRVAEGQQHLPGPLALAALKRAQGLLEGCQAEIRLALGAVQPVKKRGQVQEFRSGVQEVKLQQLLSCHNIVFVPMELYDFPARLQCSN